MSYMNRFSPLVATVIAFTGGQYSCALSADPEKDPHGWNDVRLGMTTEEFRVAMAGQFVGGESRIAPLRPLMLDRLGTVDLPAAMEAALRLRKGEGKTAEDAQRLARLVKLRSWKLFKEETVPNFQTRLVPASALSGTLKSFAASGSPESGNYRLMVTIERNGNPSTVETHERFLDKTSQKYIQTVIDASLSLSDRLLKEQEKAPKADANFTGTVALNAIRVRNVEMHPEVDLVGGAVTRIHLGNPVSYSALTPEMPNAFGIHRTLVDALTDKFGNPDERDQISGLAGAINIVIWRFPTTVIRCQGSKLGVNIFYEAPDDRNASGTDKL